MGASVVIAADVASVSSPQNCTLLIHSNLFFFKKKDGGQFTPKLWRFLVRMVAHPEQMESFLKCAQHTSDTRDTESIGIVGFLFFLALRRRLAYV